VITSSDNQQLKTIRKLHEKKHRERDGLFVAEGEDLVEAARAAGWKPEALLVAGEDVEPKLLDAVSTLGSGTRAIAIFRQRWSEPGGDLSVYLHGVHDPGNVGTVIRSAHAFADESGALGMALCALVEAVDLELQPVVAEVVDQVPLEEARGLVGAEARIVALPTYWSKPRIAFQVD